VLVTKRQKSSTHISTLNAFIRILYIILLAVFAPIPSRCSLTSKLEPRPFDLSRMFRRSERLLYFASIGIILMIEFFQLEPLVFCFETIYLNNRFLNFLFV
jgi:hypothetical protein